MKAVQWFDIDEQIFEELINKFNQVSGCEPTEMLYSASEFSFLVSKKSESKIEFYMRQFMTGKSISYKNALLVYQYFNLEIDE